MQQIDKSVFLSLVTDAAAGRMDVFKERVLTLAEEAEDAEFKASIAEAYSMSRGLPIGLYKLNAFKTLADLDLTPEVATSVNAFINEQRKADRLKKGGMVPRHKMLLIGPPGNGKTVLAGAVSIELGVPSFMVRYDDLISKVPGETSRNLLSVFSWARQQNCLLFFDEFDALGRERGDAQETGEMKRVTSTLLVQIDDIPSHVVCMAATNHAQMLDAAIWRRFNVRLELPRPRLEKFDVFMHEYAALKKYPIDASKVDLDLVAHRALFENFSDAELFVNNSIRKMLLSDEEMTLEEAVMVSLDEWTSGQRKVL